MKTYRFFYHYHKQKDCLSIHFKNKCHQVDAIKCEVPCESKRNKQHPKIVMQGWAQKIDFTFIDGVGAVFAVIK